MSWKRQIVAWGNSLGVRIPNQVFQKTNLKEGDDITVEIHDEETVVLRKQNAERMDSADLEPTN